MSDKKISGLPPAGPITGEEYMAVVQDGVTKKAPATSFIIRSEYEAASPKASDFTRYLYGYRMTDEQMSAWWAATSEKYRSLYGISETLKVFFDGLETGASAIDKWRELEAFLEGITTEESLTGLLEELKSGLLAEIGKKASTLELASEINRATSVEAMKADKAELSAYQKKLVAGANISIDNSNPDAPVISSTGGGSGGGGISDAPADGNAYARKDNGWEALKSVALTGSYNSLSDIPISEITPESADRLSTSSSSRVYIFVDGSERGLLLFECFGPSSARQTLYMNGIVKQRNALGINSWQEWREVDTEKKTLYIDSATPKNDEGRYEIDLSDLDELIVNLEVESLSEFQWIITALPLSDKSFTKEIDCLMSTPGMVGNANSMVIDGTTYGLDINVYRGVSYSNGSSPIVNALTEPIYGFRGLITENKRFKLFMSFDYSTLTYTLTFIPIS